MKLRIRGNSIRLRLTKGEVDAFAKTGLVENKTEFAGGRDFVYSVSASDSASDILANFEAEGIQVIVPKMLAKHWTNTNDVGIEGTNGALKIIIEKDFACLTVRKDEDESDAFPHPNEKEISC